MPVIVTLAPETVEEAPVASTAFTVVSVALFATARLFHAVPGTAYPESPTSAAVVRGASPLVKLTLMEGL